MGFFNHDDSNEEQAYQQVNERDGSVSHELVGGAAAFLAMRAYEKKQDEEGKPQSWETAKELMAAIAGAEADKLIETKGLNEVDALRARHNAQENAKHALAQSGEFGDVGYQKRSFEDAGY
ncbi:hypothetical protein QFC22_006150 [Naganishia vaughanmartiniae]|uniref:Uncharacterized protein n=1 Tax=Naganishia vaughanmartiniae TaxID=1424756 RepID=A0ACC2WPH5_9TREE|nr:hypothetical protein QFC22_006150 [Naganishia vaughanmartiniae]